jgi:hypothetical protein
MAPAVASAARESRSLFERLLFFVLFTGVGFLLA